MNSSSARIAIAAFVCVAMAPQPSDAQRPDSTRVVVAPTTADTGVVRERRPPISARRAFLTSLMLPGYGQSMLGRKRSGAMMLAMEGLAVAMLRESAIGLREAKRNSADSLIVAYVSSTGVAAVQYQGGGFSPGLVRARKEHVEDWIALIVANHLFSGADAFVAALLWDLPAEVAVGAGRRSTNLGLRVRF